MQQREIKIKICGLTRPIDCDMVNRCQVDYAGFVFAPSRRQVDAATAALLAGLLHPDVSPVGVFTDQPSGLILETARESGLAVIQLHGEADPDTVALLRRELPPQTVIWQRLAVSLDLIAYEARSRARQLIDLFYSRNILPDAWLLDSARAERTGGTGEIFDWNAFSDFEQLLPVVLAGGLNANNIQHALRTLHPAVVDTSSGVETAGVKDLEKIQSFCLAVRQFQTKPDQGDDLYDQNRVSR